MKNAPLAGAFFCPHHKDQSKNPSGGVIAQGVEVKNRWQCYKLANRSPGFLLQPRLCDPGCESPPNSGKHLDSFLKGVGQDIDFFKCIVHTQ